MRTSRLLILCDPSFNCQSKFDRKVKYLTSSLDSMVVVYVEDHHGIIKRFAEQEPRVSGLEKTMSISSAGCTHAILVGDESFFAQNERELSRTEVAVRKIRFPITRVINIQDAKGNDEFIYIGRGAYWGNPYPIGADGDDREDVIRKFKFDFERDIFPKKRKSEVFKLQGKTLGCHCKPLSCHGDVLADFLNSYDDGK